MLHQNVLPTGASFIRILKDISDKSHLESGKHVHACIRHSPFIHDAAVCSTLVSMYGKCGSFDDALKSFIDMPSSSASSSPPPLQHVVTCNATTDVPQSSSSHAVIWNSITDVPSLFPSAVPSHVVTWNAIISVCGSYDKGLYAHHLFEKMLLECVVATNVTFICLIKAYTRQGMLSEGKQLHARIYGSSLELDIMVRNGLSSMYNKCGRPDIGLKLFDNSTSDVYSNQALLEEDKHMPSHICGRSLEGDMMVKKGRLGLCKNKPGVRAENGLKLCDHAMSGDHNVVSWTSLISSCLHQGHLHESLSIYNEMQQAGVIPNSYTFSTLLSGCSNNAASVPGKLLHFHAVSCYHNLDTVIGNTLIRMYSMCGFFEDACKVFEDLNNCDDVVAWTSIIAAYTHHRIGHEAMQTFKKMQERGVFPDKITFLTIIDAVSNHDESKRIHVGILSDGFERDIAIGSALVSMYAKCSQAENAWNAFSRIQDHNIVTWNVLIATFAQAKQTRKAFTLFYQMQQEGLVPDKSTYVGILEACASKWILIESSHVHVQIISSSLRNDVILQTSLIHMYGKTGNVERARFVFGSSTIQDRPTWNAMIVVFSQHGKGTEAIQLFDRMNQQGVAPDEITWMGMLLACSHSGLVEEGWTFLSLMINKYGVKPDIEHFNCMVDLLGRAGCLDEGELLIKRMGCQPNVTTWTALLSACRTHQNLDLGDIAAMHAYRLEPRESGTYVLLSDIHVKAR